MQVDIIAIDFSEKLPFRLKQSMVKAAVKVSSSLLASLRTHDPQKFEI